MKKTSILFFVSAIFLLATSCTPAESTLPTTTPEPTGTPLPTSTPIPTATPQPPIAMVGGKMHCFDAPDLEANLVTTIDIGMQVEVVGQSYDNLFWLVKADEEIDPCWLEARYATLINLDNQEIAKIQATATATLEPLTIPEAPENFSVEGSCPIKRQGRNRWFNPTFTLKWEPVKRATGYLIYRDGDLIKEVDPSVNEFTDGFEYKDKGLFTYVYAIQAFNEMGKSEKIIISASTRCVR